MHRPVKTLAVAVAVAALAGTMALSGCLDVTGGPLVRPGEPVARLDVINASSFTINGIAISDCRNSTYGLNRLPAGTAIRPGQSYSFTLSAGCWDVYVTQDGRAEARRRMQIRPNMVMQYTLS